MRTPARRRSSSSHSPARATVLYRTRALLPEAVPEAALAFDHAYSLDQSMLHTRVGKALSVLIGGDRNAAAHVLQLTELESTEREVSDAEALFRIAEGYAGLGDTGGALRVLGRSIEGGFFCYPYLARDPVLESIRSAPEFQNLLERARERHEAFRRRFF